MNYEDLAKSLEIDRGQLEHGFRQEMGCVMATKPRVNLPPGTLPEPKIEPEPEGQYVHLNAKSFFTHQRNGTIGGRKKKK